MHPENDAVLAFPGLTGRGVKVAIVDSGVDASHPRVRQVTGGVDLTVGPDGQIVAGTDLTDCAGHGTACAGIILGTLALRTRSIWGGVLIHVSVAITMDLLALYHTVGLPGSGRFIG